MIGIKCLRSTFPHSPPGGQPGRQAAPVQHIGLRREDEDGNVIAEYADLNGLDPRVVASASPQSSCLRFIDPCGDTVFNQLQLPALISEMQTFAAICNDTALKAGISGVVEFLCASVDVHTYVRFIGDQERVVPPNYRLDRTGGWQLRSGQGGSMIGIKQLRSAFTHSPPGGQPGR